MKRMPESRHVNLRGKSLKQVVEISMRASDEIVERSLEKFIDASLEWGGDIDDIRREVARTRRDYAISRPQREQDLTAWLKREFGQ